MRGRIGVSRALPVRLKERLLREREAVEFPALRGRTVVPADWEGTLVLGHPNYFGLFEPASTHREIRVTGPWSLLRPVPEGSCTVGLTDSVSEAIAEKRLADARFILRRLRQLPGVQSAVRVQSPILIMTTPGVVPQIEAIVSGVTILGKAFPEYPGGLRIKLPANVVGFDVVGYADVLKQQLTRET